MPDKPKKIRMTLDLTPDRYERLQVLEDELELSSKSDVVRKALLLYEFFHGRLQDNWKIVLEKDGKQETLIVLGLMP